jgi:hypothetical protein
MRHFQHSQTNKPYHLPFYLKALILVTAVSAVLATTHSLAQKNCQTLAVKSMTLIQENISKQFHSENELASYIAGNTPNLIVSGNNPYSIQAGNVVNQFISGNLLNSVISGNNPKSLPLPQQNVNGPYLPQPSMALFATTR